MAEKEDLFKLLHEIVLGISETTDFKVLSRYEKILNCLGTLIKNRK